MLINKGMENWKNKRGVEFLKKIGIKPNQIVLDFGCGKGNYSIPAAKIVNKKGFVYALDKNPEVLSQLNNKARKEGLNIKTINGSGIKTNLKDNMMDVVLLYDIIHLVGKDDSSTYNDRKRLYKEIYRLTKTNGLISVYPTHLQTHTDVNLIEDIKKEFVNYFKFEKEFFEELVHDDRKTKGYILNFRKE